MEKLRVPESSLPHEGVHYGGKKLSRKDIQQPTAESVVTKKVTKLTTQ